MQRSAGVDWAKDEHAACVVDAAGQIVATRRISHDEAGLVGLCHALLELGVGRVALERPDGVLVERLLEAGLVVLAIHPNQVRAARERYSVAGGKSDAFDAFVLAELARTDAHRFRVLCPDADETKALRALTRAREDLVATRVALANQLRAELERFWPGALRLFAEIDSPIGLAFLERYPSPTDARGLGLKRLASFLERQGYSGKQDPALMIERLREAPRGTAGELEVEARRGIVLSLVAALRPLVAQITALSGEITGAVRAHPDGHIFLSLFRGRRTSFTAARLVAELGDCRARYPTEQAMAADAGMCPVAVESGKRRVASFRRACDHRLRNAMTTLADTSRHTNPWARRIYERARTRGKSHPHAIRILGRAWVRVLWRLWHDGVGYDPARHGGLQRLLPGEG